MYNFLSAPNLAVNIKTEEASFKLHGGKLTVDGSFMTEAHVVARVGGSKQKWANFSFWASELTNENWSWRMIDGTCGGHYTKLGPGGVKNCEELNIKVEIPRDPPPTDTPEVGDSSPCVEQVDYSSATVSIGNWTFTVRGNSVYDRISGALSERFPRRFRDH